MSDNSVKLTAVLLHALRTHWRLAVASLLLLTSIVNLTDDMVDSMGRGFLKQESIAFLREVELREQETFLLLSTLKASMAVLGSSSAGFSFIVDVNVTLGEIFSPLQDMLDHAWEFSLGSLSVILMSQLLLEIVEKLFEPYLLMVVFLWFGYEFLRFKGSKYVVKTKIILRSAVTLLLFLFIAFPLAIASTSMLSGVITKEMSTTINAGLERHNQIFLADFKGSSLKNSAEQSITLLKENKSKIKTHISTMHIHLYTHIALGIIQTVLLPMMLLWLFLKVIRLFTGAPVRYGKGALDLF